MKIPYSLLNNPPTVGQTKIFLTAPRFESSGFLKSGVVLSENRDGKRGAIDIIKGTEVLPYEYDKATFDQDCGILIKYENENDGSSGVYFNSTIQCIDKQGKIQEISKPEENVGICGIDIIGNTAVYLKITNCSGKTEEREYILFDMDTGSKKTLKLKDNYIGRGRTDLTLFSLFKGANDDIDREAYLFDSNLKEITVPKGFKLTPTGEISDSICYLNKNDTTNYTGQLYFWDTKGNNGPIGPYEKLGTFNNGKCIAKKYNGDYFIIDKNGTELLKVDDKENKDAGHRNVEGGWFIVNNEIIYTPALKELQLRDQNGDLINKRSKNGGWNGIRSIFDGVIQVRYQIGAGGYHRMQQFFNYDGQDITRYFCSLEDQEKSMKSTKISLEKINGYTVYTEKEEFDDGGTLYINTYKDEILYPDIKKLNNGFASLTENGITTEYLVNSKRSSFSNIEEFKNLASPIKDLGEALEINGKKFKKNLIRPSSKLKI